MPTKRSPKRNQDRHPKQAKPAARRSKRKASQEPAVEHPPESAEQEATLPIILGIGASAGGLDALRTLLESMPVDTGVAFVVVQHLDPTRRSLSVELLTKYTTMKVVEISDDMP